MIFFCSLSIKLAVIEPYCNFPPSLHQCSCMMDENDIITKNQGSGYFLIAFSTFFSNHLLKKRKTF